MASEVILTLFDKTKINYPVPPDKEFSIIAKHVKQEIQVGKNILLRDKFFIKTVGNRLINPNDYSLYELRKNDSRFVEVSEDVYNTYDDVINFKSVVPLRSLEMRVNNA